MAGNSAMARFIQYYTQSGPPYIIGRFPNLWSGSFNLYSLMKQRSCQTVKPHLPSPLCPVFSFHHHHPVPPLFQKIPPGDWGRCLERPRDASYQRRPGGTVRTHLKHKSGSFSHVGVYHNSICLNDQYSSFTTNSWVFPPNQAGPPLVGWGWKFSLKNSKSIS